MWLIAKDCAGHLAHRAIGALHLHTQQVPVLAAAQLGWFLGDALCSVLGEILGEIKGDEERDGSVLQGVNKCGEDQQCCEGICE